MEDLIEALKIFFKYTQTKYPTHCCHDELWIMDVSDEQVSAEDKERLDKLGFFWDQGDECFKSFRYGSA
jgi:hypothetical protein